MSSDSEGASRENCHTVGKAGKEERKDSEPATNRLLAIIQGNLEWQSTPLTKHTLFPSV